MKAIVTGAGGFIGGRLVERLVSDGHSVVGVDRKPHGLWTAIADKCWQWKRLDVSLLCNLCHLPSVMERFAGAEVVYHLAAESRIQPSFDDPVEFVRSNTLGTAAVLDWATKNGARVVYAGSSTADDDVRKNVYALTKKHGEELCATYKRCFETSACIARFYNVYGPGQVEEGPYATVVGVFEKQFREGRKLTVTGDGSQRRDFTHVDDIVDGLVRMGQQQFGGCPTFPLGSGVNYSVLEVAEMFVGEDRIEFVPKRPGESACTLARSGFARNVLGWSLRSSDLPAYVRSIVEGSQR